MAIEQGCRDSRRQVRQIKRDLHMSRAELREVVDAPARQRIAREIASLEARLMERGVEF